MDYHVAIAPRNDEVVNWIATKIKNFLAMTKIKRTIKNRPETRAVRVYLSP